MIIGVGAVAFERLPETLAGGGGIVALGLRGAQVVVTSFKGTDAATIWKACSAPLKSPL